MEGNYFDLGVVLFQTGDGSGTYVDGGGRTKNAGTASSAGFVDGTVFQAGRADELAAAIHIARVHGTNVHVQLLQRRDDRNNPGIFGFAPVMTTRSDTGVAAFAHTIAASDSADLFLTCPPQGSGSFKFQVKVDNDGTALAAGDKVVIGAGIV